MAPPKTKFSETLLSKRMTRSQNKPPIESFVDQVNKNGKRRNDENINKQPIKRQRNVTNMMGTNESKILTINNATNNPAKINVTNRPVLRSISNVGIPSVSLNCALLQKNTSAILSGLNLNNKSTGLSHGAQPFRQPKITTRATRAKAIQKEAAIEELKKPIALVKRRISNECNESTDSLYYSTTEDLSSSSLCSSIGMTKRLSIDEESNESMVTAIGYEDEHDLPARYKVPPGIVDFDKKTGNSVFDAAEYAMDIFTYLKQREKNYPIIDYMGKQPQLNPWMRTLLVDWMCEVQENFEMNHESLYLAVKLVDSYLGKLPINKQQLQLVGAAALLLASKYDVRDNSNVDDFKYVCDDVYTREEILKMEFNVFKAVNYDLAYPLSYVFLRRYARCGNVSLPLLTYARYILETNLMNYATITFSDSKMACAALFMALKFSDEPGWNKTLEYYTGYKLEDFQNIISVFNSGMQRKPHDAVKTVKMKYSSKLFFSVATYPVLSTEEYFNNFKMNADTK